MQTSKRCMRTDNNLEKIDAYMYLTYRVLKHFHFRLDLRL